MIYSGRNMIKMNQIIFYVQKNFSFSPWVFWSTDNLESSAVFPSLNLLCLHLRYLHTSRVLSSRSWITLSHYANLSAYYADSLSWTHRWWPPGRSWFFRTALRWLSQEDWLPMARETLAIFQQIEQTVNTVFLAQKYQLWAFTSL